MRSKLTLSIILKYLVYAAAFTPLIIFSEFISPFHFGKVVVFRSIVEVMLVFYLLLIWQDRSYWVKWDKITWAFFFFTAAFTLTTFTGINIYQSFWGTLERMGGLWSFWHYFVYFIILTSVIRTRDDWFKFFKLFVAIGILSALYGFGQKTDIEFFVGGGHRARIFGTIGNTALFAGYQLLILFLSLTLLLKKGNTKNEKLLYSAGVSLTAIAVMMTAVRGSLLALGAGLFLFFLLYSYFFNSRRGKKISLTLIALVVIFILFSAAFHKSDFVKNSRYLTRLTDLSVKSYTVQTRFWAWQAGIDGWNDSFKSIILGWGPENFNVPFSIHFNPKFYDGPGSETLFDRAHNMFVEILVTMGLLGFATYLGLFAVVFSALKKVIKKDQESSLFVVGMIALVVVYMIHNSFIFDTSANLVAFFSILGFIKFLSAGNVAMEHKPRVIKSSVKNIAALAMFIVIAVVIYQTNIIPSKANYATTRAIIRGWGNDFNGSVAKYKEALKYETFGKYEERHRFAQFVLDFVSSGKINPERAEVLKYVIEEVKKNVAENNSDYLPYLYLSRLNIVLGKDDPKSPYNDIALDYAQKALDISPTFVRTYFEVAQVYLNKKDYAQAADWFEKAANLNPEVGISYWYWGMTEIQAGHIDKGVNILQTALNKHYSASEGDLAGLLKRYIDRNYLPGIIDTYERLISINPKNAQYHASLASAYAQAGRIDDAVAQARETIKLDPSFDAEAKTFIRSLGREF